MSNSKERTTFPLIPIEEVAKKIPGAIKIGPFGSQLKKEDLSERGYKVYGQENIIAGDFSLGTRRIDSYKFSALRSCQLLPGDVVVTMMGTVGRCAIFPADAEAGIMDSHLLRIQVDPNVADAKFIASMIAAEDIVGRQVTRMSHGTIMSGLSSAIVRQLLVPLPPPKEQRSIAAIINTVDIAIQHTNVIVSTLRQVKAGLIHDLLTYGLDRLGNLRDPIANPEQFENSLLGKKPIGWEVVTLADKKNQVRPYIKTGPFGSSLKGEHWVTEGVPVITIGALGEGEIIRSELLFISPSKARSLEPYTVKTGDLVFSRVADVGRSIVIGEAEDGWIMSSNLMRISLDLRKVNPYFIYLSIVYNEKVREQIRRLVNAGGRDIVNTPILDSIKFALPLLGEQDEIVKTVLAHNARINAEENTRDKLKAVKQGLMQDLLTGRVRVPPSASPNGTEP